MNGFRTVFVGLFVAFVFAASASALPPVNHAVWTKASAALTAQASTAGVTADCTPWASGPSAKFTCTFGTRGSTSLQWAGTCKVAVVVWAPRSSTDTRLTMVSQGYAKPCQPGWSKKLPTPWKPAAITSG